MAARQRTSKIWSIPVEEFAKHTSIASLLRSIDTSIGAGSYRIIRRRISEEKIDISHFDPNVDRSRNNGNKGIPLDEILIKDSPFKHRSSKVKEKMLKAGLLKNECGICHMGSEWNGKPIVHRLDHINGDSGDYRIENLRMVCSNCDSQLPTFSGRNKK